MKLCLITCYTRISETFNSWMQCIAIIFDENKNSLARRIKIQYDGLFKQIHKTFANGFE